MNLISIKKLLAITGSNGFLGQHLIKYALSQGWKVRGIVRRPEAAKIVEELGAEPCMIKSFNKEAFLNAFKGCKAIVHFANVVCGSPELFEKVNVQGTKSIIKAAEKSDVERIVYPSGLGTSVYNEYEWSSNEYFKSKSRAEAVIKESSVPYAIFRPAYILGPGDELIPSLIEQIGEDLVIIAGDGKIPTQPIYVGDAVKAFLAAADGKGIDNKIYYLVGPKIVTMNELVNLVIEKIRDFGFNISLPRIKHLSYDKADEELDLCKEMIDVMRCDLIKDGDITSNELGYRLTPLEKAVEEAVRDKMIIQVKEKRALILLSGGIDSTTALFWAKDQGYDVYALSIDYYLRPNREKEASAEISHEVGAKFIEISLPFIKEAFDLRIEGLPSPCAINTPEGFIPHRNLVFYSLGAFFAEAYACEVIVGGHLNPDSNKFKDATPEFFSDMKGIINKSLQCSESKKINIILPFKNMKKSDVIELAIKLDVPIEKTWSCSSDGVKPCGSCSSCIEYQDALQKVQDNSSKG